MGPEVGGALTRLAGLEDFLGFAPHGLAVLLELEEARLLPRRGQDLEEIPAFQEELEVRISLHT